MSRILVSLCLIMLVVPAGAEIYRYKNEQGRWVFSDEKPDDAEHEELEVRTKRTGTRKPEVTQRREGAEHVLSARNPWHMPMELLVKSSALPNGASRVLVPAADTMEIHRGSERLDHFQTRWVMGDPGAEADRNAVYRFPVSSNKYFRISQGFNGRFSHQHEPNVHSVDVSLPVGTWLAAARGGVVARIKEDYHHSGTRRFFVDKANLLVVLHDDGTYALYAHILPDSAVVEPGQRVEAGDRLARSGSTGFSTGPHLHFVVRRNTGLQPVSVPFRLRNDEGREVTPKRGMHFPGQG